jgi:hypothetical protein
MMGAFDGELYRLGYKFEAQTLKTKSLPKAALDRSKAIEQMHLAVMPCPGSCSSVCPNHQCPSHNGKPYEWVTSHIVRHRMSLYQADQFLERLKESK